MSIKSHKIYWRGIVIHCSDSEFGTVELIDKWHRERGFTKIGYHYLITNGVPTKGANVNVAEDGRVHVGRSLSSFGAHAVGYNDTHIGICLIGKDKFSDRQFESLSVLLPSLVGEYRIAWDNVIGHNECTSAKGKTCPNFDVQVWKSKLKLKSH